MLSLTFIFSLSLFLLSALHTISGSATLPPNSPKFVIYSQTLVPGLVGPPSPSLLKGYNVFVLSCLTLEGATGRAAEWSNELTTAQRSSIKEQYSAAGITMLISLFGSFDAPTTAGADPILTANEMAAWATNFTFDGIDIAYNDAAALMAGDGRAVEWLVSFTNQMRTFFPVGSNTLSVTPFALWESSAIVGGAPMIALDKVVGEKIDWYNTQYSNNGTQEYTTCGDLLTNATGDWPDTSVFQIAANGVPLTKLVIGKPATPDIDGNGYMDPSALASCVGQAKDAGWSGGVMVYEYPDADAKWIATVRGDAFPE